PGDRRLQRDCRTAVWVALAPRARRRHASSGFCRSEQTHPQKRNRSPQTAEPLNGRVAETAGSAPAPDLRAACASLFGDLVGPDRRCRSRRLEDPSSALSDLTKRIRLRYEIPQIQIEARSFRLTHLRRCRCTDVDRSPTMADCTWAALCACVPCRVLSHHHAVRAPRTEFHGACAGFGIRGSLSPHI